MKGYLFYKTLLLIGWLSFPLYISAQEEVSDSVSTDRRSNQNVMLNASSSSQPRVISLGIPQWGTAIVDDGLPTSFYMDYFPGFWSWRNSLGTKSMTLTRLDESAIMLGNSGFFAMTTSKAGAEKLEGAVNYSIDIYGRNQIEADIASPLGNGWGINLNIYQDLNRGSNHLDLSYFQEHIQHYKLGVSKKFDENRGNFFLSYLYMKTLSLSDPYGPFIFVGDGSVKEFEDFKLGKDQYLPSTATFDYVDLKTGEKKTRRFVNDAGTPIHVVTAGLNYLFKNGTVLDVNTRLRLGKTNLTESYLSSISKVGSTDGYTYAGGSPYEGNVQTRYMLYYEDHCYEWLTTAQLKGHWKKHQWMGGLNLWFVDTTNDIHTINFAYEAKKDPLSLLYNGDMYYVHNTGAQYVDGNQSKIALFGQDQWLLNPRFTLRLGLRMEYSGIRGDGAFNAEGKENNTRQANWSLKSPGVQLNPIKKDMFNGAASLVAYYKITPEFGLEMNAIATKRHTELWQYGQQDLPNDVAKNDYLLRGGINYKNNWIDLQSLLTYIRQDNNFTSAMWTHKLDKAAGGYPAGYNESVYIGSLYSMDAVGWTTDVVLTPFKGFAFHGLFTFRSPKYRDYSFKPTFSDGYSETFDFSGKRITSSSSVEIELEPSYQWNKWRLWLSARYYSKQYVNITNSLYFNPRWETFGGIDFAWKKNISFSINVINFLNQTGASAGIQAASLATDGSAFKNYLTSGTFIRPFTIEFSTSLKF